MAVSRSPWAVADPACGAWSGRCERVQAAEKSASVGYFLGVYLLRWRLDKRGRGRVGVLMGVAVAASAQQFITTGRDTLRGLTGIEVLVEPTQPELERAGLSDASVRAGVERPLRAGGVTVFASQGANTSPAKPYLYVHINALSLHRGTDYAVAVELQLRQTLRSPVTGSNVVNALTWDQKNVVAAAADLGSVRAEVKDYVDQFIRDWLAVH